MFELETPQLKIEITSALAALARQVDAYLEALSDEIFEEPQGEYWSPAGHVRHLSKSIRAVANGMNQPRLLLRVFGRASDSRSFTELWDAYRQALADGGQAGAYGPSQARPTRNQVMDRWRSANRELESAIAKWREADLDRYRLPHPLLGKLTLREMLFFTLFHNAHHARRVHERAGE